ncbi:MAG: hypothetical protein QM680_02695 [Luteolibacter sp.]
MDRPPGVLDDRRDGIGDGGGAGILKPEEGILWYIGPLFLMNDWPRFRSASIPSIMKPDQVIALTVTFEGHAQPTGDGVEYRLARDLQHLLGYAKWDHFLNAIPKEVWNE